MSDVAWYEELRDKFRPTQVRVLLVAESPPNPTSQDRRFFYSAELTQYDNLFRSVALAAYGLDNQQLQVVSKFTVLERLQADGFWLADAVASPVNQLNDSSRRKAIRDGIPALVRRCEQAAPAIGVFICSAPVYVTATAPLRSAGLNVLNRTVAPFPLGNTRARFVECWRRDVGPVG